MLIDFRRKWVFVHVPKCAGTSIEQALRQHCDLAVEWPADLWYLERAVEIRRTLLPNWEEFQSFAVARNPWEWFHSDYHFCRRVWQRCDSPGGLFGEKVARAARQSFADFVRHETAGMTCGGIWRYYTWAGDAPLVKSAIRYDCLSEEWPKLLARLGLPNVALPRVNVTPRTKAWWRDYTPELVQLVADACCAGIAEFGWEPPL